MVTVSALAASTALFLKASKGRTGVVFFAVFFFIGLGLMKTGWGHLRQSLAAWGWPEAPGGTCQ